MADDTIRDISVSGTGWAALFNMDGIAGQVLAQDLFYQGQVVQFEQVDVAQAAIDANGRFYMWRTKKPVVFTLSVFPGSPSDVTLTNALAACMSTVKKYVWIKAAMWRVSSGAQMTFREGTLLSGLPGINADGSNTQGPKTFRFAFSEYDGITTNGGFGG